MKPRELTHDERKAAEAAFRGLPADAKWSKAAHQLYERLAKVIPTVTAPLIHSLAHPEQDLLTEWGATSERDCGSPTSAGEGQEKEQQQTSLVTERIGGGFSTREEAIEAGVLIDVTSQATEMGLTLPVGMSKSLWEFGITGSDTIPDHLHQGRLRDLLMALRIHLSHHSVILPISQFPAVLSFPPNSVPQICAISAVAQAHLSDDPVITLFLPSEINSDLSLPLS